MKSLENHKKVDISFLVHLNNFLFLVFSYCTKQIHSANFTCQDPIGEYFLN